MMGLFFWAFNGGALAQSCGPMAEGAQLRLDGTAGPLSNFKTQDQDGLGTCYANTASVMLQAKLAGHPDISYLNLAFMHAEKYTSPEVRKEGKDAGFRTKARPTDDDSFLVDGGFSCATIMAAKESGGVCQRSDVALEEFVHTPNENLPNLQWMQKEVLTSLSKYYDSVFRDFGRPDSQALPNSGSKKFNDYKTALKNVLEKKKDAFTSEACLRPDTTNGEKVLQNMVARFYQFLNGPNNVKNIRPLLSVSNDLGMAFKVTRSDGQRLIIDVRNQAIRALSSDYIAELKSNPQASPEAAMMKMISKLNPAFNAKMLQLIGGFSDEDRTLFKKDHDRYVKKDIAECMNQAKFDYFTKEEGLQKDFAADGCLAPYTAHAANIRQLVTTLDKVNFKNIDNLYQFLLELPAMNYEQAMMNIVAPECSADKKIRLPADLECQSQGIHYPSSSDAPDTEARFLAETQAQIQALAQEALAHGRVMGLSMCTGFFDPQQPDAFYNKTKQCPTAKHGFHGVALVGMRCKNGKIDYLIQNSWGDWAQAKERFADTEPGKAWISAEDIAKNTYNIEMIK